MCYIAWELHVFHNQRTKLLSNTTDLIKQCHIFIIYMRVLTLTSIVVYCNVFFLLIKDSLVQLLQMLEIN